jgi:hypothetical protein
MAKPPRPKFGEAGHEGESMSAYSARIRAWNNLGKEERSEKGKDAADEIVDAGAGATGTPKEGDKKSEGGGDYTFTGGRWTKDTPKVAARRKAAEGHRA